MRTVFEQTLMASRVTEDNGVFTISVSMLNGPTVSVEFNSESDAKIFYGTLQGKYIEALKKIQEVVITQLEQ